ncbi:2-C-methyl-D-erythritol 4-phosphate cytidylyltransferase [Alteromonas aestuariivivens]|uniref:2-C-methyl-D-erythritol 4-phosphate cytidylyltransferase n=1 Tax=Alteromonas aestuariivivens TaxID=1938339 RepID=A0A3D8MBL1_9ALTE|nr:2-C-methyl-D-erythritol 4-phosphate cytidylyltransferase [Alteromonas aestuariivivens]RDV27948.1 2-C-methyl-D-erythritol 4-phosphate cytidylyltransferase [Alteromonas aestuariivivens]
MTVTNQVVAVVPAAGIGSRMRCDRPKQYLMLGNKTILEHTLQALISHPAISRIVIALSPQDKYFRQLPVANAPWLTVVDGGTERADSVLNALHTLNADDWALVHDAARPCLNHKDVDTLLRTMNHSEVSGGILATPVRDTMKRATEASPETQAVVDKTESRERLWHALTPQLFPAGALRIALEKGLQRKLAITDEASAMEAAGYRVALIDADPANIKITRPADMPLAAFYLQQLHTADRQD